MKRNGYTIAEAIITMGIVGIVAALVIPAFVASYRKQAYASSLSKAVANLENALTTTIMRDGANDLFSTKAWKGTSEDFAKNLNLAFEKAVITQKTITPDESEESEGSEEEGSSGEGETPDETPVTETIHEITLKNGVVYQIKVQTSDDDAKTEVDVSKSGTNLMSKAGSLTIDVNGNAKPNTIGRDQFEYIIGADGHLYPLYSRDWAVYSGETYKSPETKCVDEKDLNYCGAYLRLNGYKMDY